MASLDGIITGLIDVYCTLIGFGVISASKKKDEKYDAWLKKWGLMLKIAGPVLILIGISRLFMK